ncbi:hypothetical protein GCM10029992_50580 [Glycomyces albus]
MPGLPEARGRVERGLGVGHGAVRFARREGFAGERQVRLFPGGEDAAFTALPGLEGAAGEYVEGLARSADGGQEFGVLHGQVVAALDQVAASVQGRESTLGVDAAPCVELVGLVEQAGVVGCGGAGVFVPGGGAAGVALDVVCGDTEVAKDDRVAGRGGGLPCGDGFAVAARGVQPVAGERGEHRVVGAAVTQARQGVVVRGRGKHHVRSDFRSRSIARSAACSSPRSNSRSARWIQASGTTLTWPAAGTSRAAASRRSIAASSSRIERYSRATSMAVVGSVVVSASRPSRRARSRAQASSGLPRRVSARGRPRGSGRRFGGPPRSGGCGPACGQGALEQRGEFGLGVAIASCGEVDPGGGDSGGVGPCAVPQGLAQGLPGFGVAASPGQDEAEPVVRLAVPRVRVAARQPRDGPAQMRFGLAEPSGVRQSGSQRRVAAGVARITAQGLLPVRFGPACRVPVLVEVQPGEVQLVD